MSQPMHVSVCTVLRSICLLEMQIMCALCMSPYSLTVRYQVILDATLGAPVFGQLILCYFLQVEHCYLS